MVAVYITLGVTGDMKFELETLQVYTDEALLDELCRVAAALNGERLTAARFNALARTSTTTLRTRFGSWQAALDLAGIGEAVAPRYKVLTREDVLGAIRDHVSESPSVPATRDAVAARLQVDANNITRRFGRWEVLLRELGESPAPLGRRYSDEECFENVLALWTHYGRQPHFAELNQPPSNVGSKAYVRRWGGWRNALAAFVKQVNEEPGPTEQAEHSEEATPAPLARPSSAAPRSLSLALRYKVLSRDRFRCVACGASPAKDVLV